MIRPLTKLVGARTVQSDFDRYLTVTRKNKKTELRNQARLMNRDLVKLTAPTGNAPINESFNVQRQFGMRAIESDIRKLFKEFYDLQIIKEPTNQVLAMRLRAMAQRRDYEGIKRVLQNIGFPVLDVMEAPDEHLYELLRNKKGRITGNAARRPVVVIARGSVAKLIKFKQAKVGLGKSGWLHGADKLGLRGIPNWITRHNGDGSYYEKQSADGDVITITIANRVGHVQSSGKDNRIVDRALQNRRRAWNEQIKAMLNNPQF